MEYAYTFGAGQYSSTRTSFFWFVDEAGPENIEEFRTAPHAGTVVEVLVDPNLPKRAVRLPELLSDSAVEDAVRRSLWCALAGVFAATVGVTLVFKGSPKQKRDVQH